MVVKLKGFKQARFRIRRRRVVLRSTWRFSSMSVKTILAKQTLPSISKLSVIKELFPSVHANYNACL